MSDSNVVPITKNAEPVEDADLEAFAEENDL